MDFSNSLELRIDWSEVDLFGHVNNLAILKYAQSATVLFLEKLGLMKMQEEQKKGPILASINSQFRKPLFYPGNIKILSHVDWVKNSSFGVHHTILNDQEEIATEIMDVIVFYDFTRNVKMNLPVKIREKLNQMSTDIK